MNARPPDPGLPIPDRCCHSCLLWVLWACRERSRDGPRNTRCTTAQGRGRQDSIALGTFQNLNKSLLQQLEPPETYLGFFIPFLVPPSARNKKRWVMSLTTKGPTPASHTTASDLSSCHEHSLELVYLQHQAVPRYHSTLHVMALTFSK